MMFVANSVYNNVTSGPLPLMQDVGFSVPSFCPFSHIRIMGAGTVTFDSGQVLTNVAGFDTVYAIPGAARSITVSGGTPTVQLGLMT